MRPKDGAGGQSVNEGTFFCCKPVGLPSVGRAMTKTSSNVFCLLLVASLILAACAQARCGCQRRGTCRASPLNQRRRATPPGKSASLAVLDRKVIKTGTLTLAVEAPAAALAEARAIAERHGGYLLNSSNAGSEKAKQGSRARDGVAQGARRSLRRRAHRAAPPRLGSGHESIESKDVSEEYVDVDARLRTQKRVEEQYLALLKEAKNVGETLEVHKQLTLVRTEIERLEGKQRLLEHRSGCRRSTSRSRRSSRSSDRRRALRSRGETSRSGRGQRRRRNRDLHDPRHRCFDSLRRPFVLLPRRP